ncbi:hypothetical protein [Spirochaeta cellobiosiphila]|uniref:hypothetical protein n=1 Tax=Spirochaeta cellobiosiphila TaxID=504483 RepID=UPI0004066559|nr:hypothetical protein [Spirochaeta cellobiosiphila]
MIEYKEILKEYISEYYSIYFNYDEKWGDVKKAEEYLKKYWLTADEYEATWKKIQCNIFTDINRKFPEIGYKDEYDIYCNAGGCLFTKEDFLILQSGMERLKDHQFVIIENVSGSYNNLSIPPITLRFPADISWEELNSGNYISSFVINFSEREYFVFSNSAKWGYYATNDNYIPLGVLGLKNKNIFEKFNIYEPDLQELISHLPNHLKSKVIID